MTAPKSPETLTLSEQPEDLVQQLLHEQYAAWQRGDLVSVETYRDREHLQEDADAILDLICGEVVLRNGREGRRSRQEYLQEYLTRFPHLAAQLPMHFEVLTEWDFSQPVLNPETRNVPGYELVGELGRGGMGVVYKARQLSLNRLVALKMIRGNFDSRTLQRFRDEALAAASLDHAHIVPIFEVGEKDDLPYFTMKLLDGLSLDHQLERFRADPRAAAELLVTLARAVHHAHQRGILHRDLKPSNILFDSAGQAYVADFGLAKRVEADRSMTQSADVLGTPSYMAPEQAHGKKGVMTTATDVYGLGGILYALLTGRPPFKGGTWVELLKHFEEGPERPSLGNANVDRDLEMICLKCLDKDPRHRYSSAEQLADELQQYLNGEPLRHTRAVSRFERLRRWCSRKPMEASLAAAVLLVALLIPVGVISYLRAENSRGRELAARQLQYESDISFGYKLWAEGMDLDRLEQLLANHVPKAGEDDLRDKRWLHLKSLFDKSAPRTIDIKGPLFRFTMAPNGQIFATSGFDDKQVKIWQTAKGKLLHTLSDTGRVERLAFAGDNTTLATAHGTGRVKLWNATTGKLLGTLEHFSADDPHPIRALAFGGKDGKLLATAGEDGIVKVWDVGRNALVDTFPFDAKTLTSMAFSPDGNILAIGTADGEVNVGVLATKRQFSLKRTRQPFAHAGVVYSLAFAGDNTTLASGGDDRAIVVWDLAGMDNEIQESAVFNGESEIVTALAYAKKERGILASVSSDGALKVWNLNNATSKPAILKGHRDGLRAAAFFPDGMTLATASNDGIVKVWDLSQREEVLELVRRTEATPWMIGD